MKEENIRYEFSHLIAQHGFLAYHPPDDTPAVTDGQIWQLIKSLNLDSSKFKLIREILAPPTWKRESVSLSRPDIYGLHPLERSIVIEVKAVKPKVNVEPWIDPAVISEGQRNWLDTWKFQLGGLGYLGIGTLEGSPRRAWLIPWDFWAKMEQNLGETSIDFKITLSMLPEEFELEWVKGSPKCPWKLKEGHSLLPYSTPDTNPYKADWKKIISFRFAAKKEKPSDTTNEHP